MPTMIVSRKKLRKNIPFGQMDILPVVQEMYRKKCGRDIYKIKVEKEGDSGC